VSLSNPNAIIRSYEVSGTCTEHDVTTGAIAYRQYCCTKDLCNEASMGKANFIFAVLTTVISLLLLK